MSPKHKKFCASIAAGYSQVQAYIDAGYNPGPSARTNAARLITKDNIKAEIDRMRAKLNAKVDITLESMIEDMQKLHDLAIEKGDLATARGCKAEQIKLVGLYAPVKTENKTEVTGDMAVNTNQLETDTLQALVAQKQKDKGDHASH